MQRIFCFIVFLSIISTKLTFVFSKNKYKIRKIQLRFMKAIEIFKLANIELTPNYTGKQVLDEKEAESAAGRYETAVLH